MCTGKCTLNSRRGSRRTSRSPGSSWSSSAARSNWRCATCHVLMVLVACSMVIWVGVLANDGERRAPDWWAGWLAMQRSGPTVHRMAVPAPAQRYRAATCALPDRNPATRAAGGTQACPDGAPGPVAWSGHVRASRPLPVLAPLPGHRRLVGHRPGGRGTAHRRRLGGHGPGPARRGTGRSAHRRWGRLLDGRPAGRASTGPSMLPVGSMVWCARPGCRPRDPWDDAHHWADVLRVDLTAPYDAARLAWPQPCRGARGRGPHRQHRRARRRDRHAPPPTRPPRPAWRDYAAHWRSSADPTACA